MLRKTFIYLAPFQGITGVTFREVYTRHFCGVDKLFTPFFTNISNDSKLPPRKQKELGNPCENSIEVVPQILSKDAGEIIRFARFCRELGFSELNWNLGCPYPQVANKKRGSGMLPYPALIEQIMQQLGAEMPVRFSVKCRLGYFSPDEIAELIPIFNHHTISEVTIHARIGKQLYSGETDILSFRNAASILMTPVVYNGDIFSLDGFLQIQDQLPSIHTWMIGRGLLADPFLPSLIKGLSVPADQKSVVKKFISDLYYVYRRQLNDSLAVLGILKEYWQYLALSFSDPHKVFRCLKKVKSFDEYEDAVRLVFDEYEWIGSAGRLFGEDINPQVGK